MAHADPAVIGGDLLIDQDSQFCFVFQSLQDCIQQQFILEHAAGQHYGPQLMDLTQFANFLYCGMGQCCMERGSDFWNGAAALSIRNHGLQQGAKVELGKG